MFICEFLRVKSHDVGKRIVVCGRAVPAYLWALYTNIGEWAEETAGYIHIIIS